MAIARRFLIFFLMLSNAFSFAQEELPIFQLPLAVSIEPIQDKIQAFKGNGQYHVVYELVVTNFSKNPVQIHALHIQGKKCKKQNICLQSGPFDPIMKKCELIYEMTIRSDDLSKIFAFLSNDPLIPQNPLLQPNQTGVFFLFLDFSTLCTVPDIIENILDIEVIGEPFNLHRIDSNFIKVNKNPPIVISAPLEGEKWIAGNGPSNFNAHRRAVFVINGNLKLPERFAIDFVNFGPQGIFMNNPNMNQNFYAYGQKILAVANGIVIRAVDQFPDNTPPSVPPIITLENGGGNYIIQKIDADHYVTYAHFIPGSLKVKEGDRVCAGQILGLLGNSGNSNGPHLHFQVTDQPLPLDHSSQPSLFNCQGIPWVLDRFINDEYIFTGTDPLDPQDPLNVQVISREKVKKEMIMNENLVDFFKNKCKCQVLR